MVKYRHFKRSIRKKDKEICFFSKTIPIQSPVKLFSINVNFSNSIPNNNISFSKNQQNNLDSSKEIPQFSLNNNNLNTIQSQTCFNNIISKSDLIKNSVFENKKSINNINNKPINKAKKTKRAKEFQCAKSQKSYKRKEYLKKYIFFNNSGYNGILCNY